MVRFSPLLKACPNQQLDKLFFLTAKTSGRQLALDALALLRNVEPMPSLRVLELTARDKACEHPDKLCRGESCPLAQGFYDHLPRARAAALAGCESKARRPGSTAMLSRDSVRAVALEHNICPYYLSQELIRWCDVIIGDYNHYFDLNATLHGLTVAHQWRIGLLVDEAHNLLDRARRMYTAELHSRILDIAYRAAPAELRKPLGRLQRRWNEFSKSQMEDYAVHPAIPDKIAGALQRAISTITEHIAEAPSGITAELRDFYSKHCIFGGSASYSTSIRYSIRPKSQEALQKAHRDFPVSTTCFASETSFRRPFFCSASQPRRRPLYSPPHWRRGIFTVIRWVCLTTPHGSMCNRRSKRNNCRSQVVTHISTRFHRRDTSISPIADLVYRQYQDKPGNYLAFFSSYDYLHRVAVVFERSTRKFRSGSKHAGWKRPTGRVFVAFYSSEPGCRLRGSRRVICRGH